LRNPEASSDWLGYIVHGTRDQLASLQRRRRVQQHHQHGRHATTIVVIMLSAGFAQRFGKKAVAVAGFALSTLNAFAFYFLAPDNVTG
jgi:GPH family glycoside/pentoside/hexuronide:cation symporter